MGNNSVISGFDDNKNESLKIEIKELDNIPRGLLITLDGFVDTYNTHFLQNQLTKITKAGFANLIMDCENLSYISSTGVGIFSTFNLNMKQKGGNVVLLKLSDNILEILQLLGFAKLFTLKDTFEDAVAVFSSDYSAETKSSFPLVFDCPSCNKKLRATRAGRFRCLHCKSIIKVNDSGEVLLD